MNILYIALLLCVVCHVLASGSETSVSLSKRETSLVPVGEDTVASSTEAQPFVGAVQEGNMDAARNVFYSGNDRLKEYCGKYLVSLGKSELVRLINGARDYIKTWMLRVILVYADQALFDEVSAEIKPTDRILSGLHGVQTWLARLTNFSTFLEKSLIKESKKRLLEMVLLHCLMLTNLNTLILCFLHSRTNHLWVQT